jgi:hypothetical protein
MTAETVPESLPLVPGRDCGYCTVCCYATHVDTPEFKKEQGIVCAHCTGRGCGIYETRYAICRTFHCGWRYATHLGEEWRPDRSGVLVLAMRDEIPESFRYREGWNFVMLAGESAIGRLGFVDRLIDLVARGVPTFLTATGPLGAPCARMIVNDALKSAAKKGDRSAGFEILVSLHRQLRAADHMKDLPKDAAATLDNSQ